MALNVSSMSEPACPVLVFERRVRTSGIKVSQICTLWFASFLSLTAALLIIRCTWPRHLLPGTRKPPMLPGGTAPW